MSFDVIRMLILLSKHFVRCFTATLVDFSQNRRFKNTPYKQYLLDTRSLGSSFNGGPVGRELSVITLCHIEEASIPAPVYLSCPHLTCTSTPIRTNLNSILHLLYIDDVR